MIFHVWYEKKSLLHTDIHTELFGRRLLVKFFSKIIQKQRFSPNTVASRFRVPPVD